MKIPSVLSDLLFAIFMIIFGVAVFYPFPYNHAIAGILALAVGILKFLGK